MKPAHIGQILAIENDAFKSPWRREHFEHEIAETRYARCSVVLLGEEVLAYACVWELHEEFKINNIAVREERRGRGLGGWLLDRLLDHARRAGCRVAQLEVRPSNNAALKLYARRGFVLAGRRRGYYQREGEDALLMEADLGV